MGKLWQAEAINKIKTEINKQKKVKEKPRTMWTGRNWISSMKIAMEENENSDQVEIEKEWNKCKLRRQVVIKERMNNNNDDKTIIDNRLLLGKY